MGRGGNGRGTYTVHMGGTRGNPPGSADSRGNIEVLPSGSLRVRVYAGKDILTGDELYLRKTIPAGPTAWETAEKVRAGFVRQVEENRQPKTNASLVRLIAEHLKTAKVGPRAKETLEGYVRKHIALLVASEWDVRWPVGIGYPSDKPLPRSGNWTACTSATRRMGIAGWPMRRSHGANPTGALGSDPTGPAEPFGQS